MSLFDKRRLLMDAANRDPRFRSHLNVLDGAVADAGLSDDELGAMPPIIGASSIPEYIWAQQQWAARAPNFGPFTRFNLIRLNLDRKFARDWTVQFAAPTMPPGATPATDLVSTATARVAMSWGHHGSADTVEFDWPNRGGSLTVYGCTLQVDVTELLVGAATRATYNAWVSEGAAARAGLPAFQPVHVSRINSLGPGLSAVFLVPPRARAWSTCAFWDPASDSMEVTYRDTAALVRASYIVFPSGSTIAAANVPKTPIENYAFPRVLPVHASSVTITNNDAANSIVGIELQHWLDIG